MSSLLSRAGAWLIALAVGLVYGAAGSFAQATFWGPLPVGLVVGVVAGAALVLAVRLLTQDRWAALAAGLGVMLATWFFSLPSPGGSVLFTQDNAVAALVWMWAVPLVTAVVVAWPDLSAVRRPGEHRPN